MEYYDDINLFYYYENYVFFTLLQYAILCLLRLLFSFVYFIPNFVSAVKLVVFDHF